MKINLKDIKLDWSIYPEIPPFVENDFDLLSNVFFNVLVQDLEGSIIIEKKEIPSKKIDKIESFNIHFGNYLLGGPPVPMEMIASNPRKCIETNFFNQNVKKIVKENFDFLFEENADLYYKKYNKNGFFQKLTFSIIYNNSPHIEKIEIEYNNLDKNQINLQKVFPKIIKSQDNISIKFKINFEEFQKTEIESLFIVPYIYKNNEKIKLKDIYIPNIKNKWLNNSDNSKLLTIPFEENMLVLENILSLDIYFLNDVQTEILEYFKEKISKDDFNKLVKDYYGDQKIETNFIYGEDLINKIAGFYQGYIYLYNTESIKIAYPEQEESILNVKYKNYFPKALFNNKETVSLEDSIEVDSSVLQINNEILPSNMFGYKLLNNTFVDINEDLMYFKSENIQCISILEVKNILNKNNIYLEFVTNFDMVDDIYLENISNNLNFIKKYYKNLNNKNYATLLFMYEYDNLKLNQYELIDNIIDSKKFISFNIKIY